tara:strand:+ start:420 stop:575 length:156 start_codon:yes stop_codon:yes gene_type:complete
VQCWSELEGAAPAPRLLVSSHMPINSMHLSSLGTLAAASDAETLTYIDMQR